MVYSLVMQITNQPNPMTNKTKVSIAAQFLFAKWIDGECVYFDDATRKNYRCDSEEEMVDLYDLIKNCSQDAYSHWCAQTSHDEIAD